MKKLLITVVSALTFFQVVAQKIGHFSSEYVVKRMPSYVQAQNEINQLSIGWMEEIKNKYIEIGRLENELEAEKVLLTEALIYEREVEIAKELKEAIDYQHKIFGHDGLFFLKKQELIRPELEKVFEAAERVCKKQNLDYLLDKSGELVLVYTNPVHDYTDFVMEELGLVEKP